MLAQNFYQMQSTCLTLLISNIPTTLTFTQSSFAIVALPPYAQGFAAFSLSATYTYDTLPENGKRLFDSIEEIYQYISCTQSTHLEIIQGGLRIGVDFGLKKHVVLPLEKRKDTQEEKDLRSIVGQLVNKTDKLQQEMKEINGKGKHCKVVPISFPISKENINQNSQISLLKQRETKEEKQKEEKQSKKKQKRIQELQDKIESLYKQNTQLLIQNQRLNKQLKQKKQESESWRNKYEIALGSTPRQPTLSFQQKADNLSIAHKFLHMNEIQKIVQSKPNILSLCFYNTDLGDEGAQFLLKEVQWTHLKEVRLIGNKIRNLSWDAENLHALELLDVENNQLETLPPTIKMLSNLKFVNLDKNMMMLIPIEIAMLPKMEMLVIGSTHQLLRANHQYWRSIKRFVVRF